MEQFLANLTTLIKSHDYILLATHKNPDFDGLSSALALQQFINHLGKENYIILNKNELNNSIKKIFKILNENNINYQTITKNNALKKQKGLLIVLDTHKNSMLEDENLTNNFDTIVLDHHIKSQDYIKNTVLNYINSNMSSTVEIITHYLKYLNFKVNPIIATFMLTGIEIDTNKFKLKTTEQTYETAAYLTRLGADNILKQELLQENKEIYLKRHKLIEESFMINKNMAMCVLDNNIYEKQDLATIAEELLQFENVEASFTIGKIDNNQIGISARSIGKIDVEKIMKKLNGGGHANEAAAQLDDITLEEAKQKLINIIGG